jgi:nucleoside-diphosphate-sugar epimerase
MRVAVTGVTGLIGSTVSRLLRSRGDEAVSSAATAAAAAPQGPGKRFGDPPVVQTLQHRRGRKPTSDLQATADRVEIEAMRGKFTDAVMMCDYDRLASLFTPDGAARIPLEDDRGGAVVPQAGRLNIAYCR